MTNSEQTTPSLSDVKCSNIKIKFGNLFTSKCQTLVNTVNCVGVMGAGIALEFKLRLPDMFEEYVDKCNKGEIDIGRLWLYTPRSYSPDKRMVLNFPTKRHWKPNSEISYLKAGLEDFLNIYKSKGIESIAFPVLGASNGGLDEDESLTVMQNYLERCEIPVEIYRYDPTAMDDLFREFQQKLLPNRDKSFLAKSMGVRVDRLSKILNVLNEHDSPINSLSQLATVPGVGSKTLEKCFRYVMDAPARNLVAEQPSLFD